MNGWVSATKCSRCATCGSVCRSPKSLTGTASMPSRLELLGDVDARCASASTPRPRPRPRRCAPSGPRAKRARGRRARPGEPGAPTRRRSSTRSRPSGRRPRPRRRRGTRRGAPLGRPVAVARAVRSRRLVVEQPRRQRVDRALDLRDVEVDAAAGPAPVVQAGRQRGGDEAGRERVGDRAVRADGLAVGPAGQPVVPRRAPSPGRRSRGSPCAGRSGRSGTR